MSPQKKNVNWHSELYQMKWIKKIGWIIKYHTHINKRGVSDMENYFFLFIMAFMHAHGMIHRIIFISSFHSALTGFSIRWQVFQGSLQSIKKLMVWEEKSDTNERNVEAKKFFQGIWSVAGNAPDHLLGSSLHYNSQKIENQTQYWWNISSTIHYSSSLPSTHFN